MDIRNIRLLAGRLVSKRGLARYCESRDAWKKQSRFRGVPGSSIRSQIDERKAS